MKADERGVWVGTLFLLARQQRRRGGESATLRQAKKAKTGHLRATNTTLKRISE